MALLLCFSSISVLALSARSAVLYDPLTKKVLFEHNADERRGMASTTKIMTALVALELYDPLREIAVARAWTLIEGSSMYLKAGEKLTVSDLLYGLLLLSGNDAALALSSIYSGNPDDFVELMNKKAAALAMLDTHFENASGLDGETHYSTAKDMAILAAHALENPTFRDIVSTKQTKIGERYMQNHNKLLNMAEGAIGVKTGFTKKCGRCLVSACQRNGRRLIAVTLNAPDDWNDHISMFDMGFAGFEQCEISGAGDCGWVAVVSGNKNKSRLYTNESFSMLLTRDEAQNLKKTICGQRFCYAPISAGTVYGNYKITLNGKLLFETPIYFGDNVPLSVDENANKDSFLERMFMFFKNIF